MPKRILSIPYRGIIEAIHEGFEPTQLIFKTRCFEILFNHIYIKRWIERDEDLNLDMPKEELIVNQQAVSIFKNQVSKLEYYETVHEFDAKDTFWQVNIVGSDFEEFLDVRTEEEAFKLYTAINNFLNGTVRRKPVKTKAKKRIVRKR